MAKRKKKKVTKQQDTDLIIQIYGVILILASILGLGKYGPVGKIITSFSMFLVGSLYIPLLVVFFIVGFYLIFKRDWPDFFSTKMMGIYLSVIGFLILMHEKFVLINDSNMMATFQDTINQLVLAFNEIMAKGALGDWLGVGGGIIGGVFAIIFAKLFSYTGMQIVSWVLMITGICMFTGFSIIDFIKEKLVIKKSQKAKDKDTEKIEKDGEKVLSDREPIIHDSNNVELNQIKITNINDLKETS